MSKINPLVFALGIPFVVIAVLLFVVLGRSGGKFTNLSPFSLKSYRQDWTALQGNSYRLDCKVEQQLAFLEGKGRLLVVSPIVDRDKEMDKANLGRLPVFVPADASQSFEVGQRFKFKVRLNRDLLLVEDLERF
ncbi:MAG: hypothetical protein RLZZ550_943 [Verrucomicrobiota bacterium]|jgi:hypothetical protein